MKDPKNGIMKTVILVLVILTGIVVIVYGGTHNWFKFTLMLPTNPTLNMTPGIQQKPLTSCREVCAAQGYKNSYVEMDECKLGESKINYGYPEQAPLLSCCCYNPPTPSPGSNWGNVTDWCNDPDVGLQQFTLSTSCTDKYGSKSDGCYNSDSLDEIYCNNNQCVDGAGTSCSVQFGTGWKCVAGKCQIQSTGDANCTDSDGTAAYTTGGWCKDSTGQYYDSCPNAVDVKEWFCNSLHKCESVVAVCPYMYGPAWTCVIDKCINPGGSGAPLLTSAECQAYGQSLGKDNYYLMYPGGIDQCGGFAWANCNGMGKTLKYFDWKDPNCCVWQCE